MPCDVILILPESDQSDNEVINIDAYAAVKEWAADTNGDIEPNSPGCAMTPISTSATRNKRCESPLHEGDTFVYHMKIQKLAQHLTNVANATIRQKQSGIALENDSEFTELLYLCDKELVGIREYILDVANSISEGGPNDSASTHVSNVHDSATTVTDSVYLSLTTSALSNVHDIGNSGYLLPTTSKLSAQSQLSTSYVSNTLDTSQATSSATGKDISTNSQIYTCELCSDQIDNKIQYHAHLNHHTTILYKCKKCGQIFFSCFQLNKHVMGHVKGTYECAECGK